MGYADIRRYHRANVGPGVTIQFKVRGRFFIGLNVVSLGAGGCSVKISPTLAASLHPEDLLTRMFLQHPNLPRTPLEGKISWIRGKQPGLGEDSVVLGIEFTDPDENFVTVLEAYVIDLLKVPQ